jgi:Spy/CpxP family protein refolding chaperone
MDDNNGVQPTSGFSKKAFPWKPLLLYSALGLSVLINIVVLISVLAFSRHHPPFMQPPGFGDLGPQGPGFPEKADKARLALNDDQKTKLKDIRDNFMKSSEDDNKKLKDKKKELVDELKKDSPDTAKIKTIIDEKAKFEAELEKKRVKQVIEMQKILEPAQREILVKWLLMKGMGGRDAVGQRWQEMEKRPFYKKWFMRRQGMGEGGFNKRQQGGPPFEGGRQWGEKKDMQGGWDRPPFEKREGGPKQEEPDKKQAPPDPAGK